MKKRRFLALLMLCAVLALSLCTACSSTKSMVTPNTAGQAAVGTNDTAQAGTAATTAEKSVANAPDANAGRKVIKSAQIDMETTTYEKTVSQLQALVNTYGGYVQDSQIQGSTGANDIDVHRTATFTVMIPAEKLDAFLTGAGSYGKIINKVMKGEDITQAYADSQAKLSMLNTEQERLMAFMKQSTSVTDMLSIEKRLTDVQTQIAQLNSQLNQWDKLVSLSTVTISVDDVSLYKNKTPGFGAAIADTFTGSLQALGGFLRGAAFFFVAILPFVLFFGVLITVVIFIVRGALKRKKKKQQPPAEH